MDILWEDADLLAVNKPSGLLVDSGGRGDDLVTRTGCFAFHRLDRETSGIVLLGRSRRYAREITALFEEKRIRKAYLAVVRGEWRDSRVDLAIEDHPAVTTFRRLALGSFEGETASLIEALPKTGRTHQIRIHAAHVGHPILGDAKYGVADGALAGGSTTGAGAQPAEAVDRVSPAAARAAGHALHAHRLDFRHPASGETISVRSVPSAWLSTWLKDFEDVKLK